MPASRPDVLPSPVRRAGRASSTLAHVSARLVDWFTTRPLAIGQARVAIALTIGLVAFVDYASGIRISLAPFYLVPIALTVSWFSVQEATVAVFVCVSLRVLGDWASIDEADLPLWSWWNSLASLVILLIVVWILDALLTLRRQLELRVAERTGRLVEAAAVQRRLEQELVMIGARERNAFGQELHDDICQHLVGTAFAAKVHTRNLEAHASPFVDEAQAIVDWLEEGAHKTRQLARGLLLAEISPDRFVEQVEQLIEDSDMTGIACRFHRVGDVGLADAGVAGQVFRIVQEALRNAIRHAGSTRIDISMVGDAEAVCVIVEDDGRGPPREAADGDGMGLRIMAHRAGFIGGRLSILPAPPRGTRVILHLPRTIDHAA